MAHGLPDLDGFSFSLSLFWMLRNPAAVEDAMKP